MVVLNLFTGTVKDGSPLAINVTKMTNDKIKVNGNTLQLPIPGMYEVTGLATLTSTAEGNTGIGVYADGSLHGVASYFDATGVGDTDTIPVYDVLGVISSNVSGYVGITFESTGAPNVIGSVITIKQIQ